MPPTHPDLCPFLGAGCLFGAVGFMPREHLGFVAACSALAMQKIRYPYRFSLVPRFNPLELRATPVIPT